MKSLDHRLSYFTYYLSASTTEKKTNSKQIIAYVVETS